MQIVEPNFFSNNLRYYIQMSFEIWPSLKLAIKVNSFSQQVNSQLYLPPRNYSSMTEKQLSKVLVDDFVEFITGHDVNQEYIQDYLYDILTICNVQQDANSKVGVPFMSQQIWNLVQQLQKGNNNRVLKFQNIYHQVINNKSSIKLQNPSQSQSQQEENLQNSDLPNDQNQQDQINQQHQIDQQQKQQQQKKNQKIDELNDENNDDGWIIVKKKR